jgi:hypothetical protein
MCLGSGRESGVSCPWIKVLPATMHFEYSLGGGECGRRTLRLIWWLAGLHGVGILLQASGGNWACFHNLWGEEL